MQIQERSFSGKTFRPKPNWHISSDKKVMMAITPWGTETSGTQEIFDDIESAYRSLIEDRESTQIVEKLESLNYIQNGMRTAVMEANKKIHDRLNPETYSAGFEIFFATIVENVMTIIQIGQPFILIDSPNETLQSLGQVITASFGKSDKQTIISPLPKQLLGVHRDCSFHVFSVRFTPKDRLVLLNRNYIPNTWFNCAKADRTLEKLTSLATKDHQHIPFWMAIVNPSNN